MKWKQFKNQVKSVLDCGEIPIWQKLVYLESLISLYRREHKL